MLRNSLREKLLYMHVSEFYIVTLNFFVCWLFNVSLNCYISNNINIQKFLL